MLDQSTSILKVGLGDFIQVFAAVVAILTIVWNVFVNQRSKRADVIMNCNKRYDEIYEYKIKVLENKRGRKKRKKRKLVRKQVNAYFRRYYGLKSDQIDYWLSGHVDPETILSWFWSTTEALRTGIKTGTTIHGTSYVAGWDQVRASHEYINPRLCELIDNIINDYSKEEDPERRYAKLFCELELIEKKEERLIRSLSSPVPFTSAFNLRQKMPTLVKTLPPNIERQIKDVRAMRSGRKLF